jgi:hypothetical protein
MQDFKSSSEGSATARSHLQFLGLPECFATLQTAERRTGSARTRRVVAASPATAAVVVSVLLLLLLLVLLVVLHVRGECRGRVVTPVTHRALERLLVVMRLHVNLQVVTAINNELK